MQDSQLDFQRDVIEASRDLPVVVDFWAEWCGPCRILGPVLEKLAAEARGRWKLVKLNTETHPQIAMQYRIQSIPAVKMFSDGKVVAEFVGALPEVQVRRWLDEHIPSETQKTLAAAQQAIANGDRSKGRNLLQQALASEPDNDDARVLLAELEFESDPAKARKLVPDISMESEFYARGQAISRLTALIENFEDLAKTARESERNPKAWEHYLGGIQALKNSDYDKALQNWIEALLVDRSIDDDGPRQACVAVFTYLGQDHEITRKYHRSFTSALF